MIPCRVKLLACLLFVAVDAQRTESDCGTLVERENSLMVNGAAATNLIFPWHVGVYQQTENELYGPICGGTLISSDIVISAGSCFYDEKRRQLRDAREFKIVTGKYYSDYVSPNDTNVQQSSVKSINIPDRYIGIGGDYVADIALVRVKTPFSTNALVKPVCVHWDIMDGFDYPLTGKIGKVVGWNFTETTKPSETLKEIYLPTVDSDNCLAALVNHYRPLIPQNKFLAVYSYGSTFSASETGGGLCFEHRGRWYLRGILTFTVLPSYCDRNKYAPFTDVDLFQEWINSAVDDTRIAADDFLDRAENSKLNVEYSGCTLPEQPIGGKFEIALCAGRSCDVTPARKVASDTHLVFSCDEGYALRGNESTGCRKGEWYLLPTCVKTCPPLTSRSVDIVYDYQSNGPSGDTIIFPGTKATLKCKKFYEIHQTNEPGYGGVTCLESGEWDRPLFDCTAATLECGKAAVPVTPLIKGGSIARDAEFPWHVGIYRKGEKDDWKQICGGSLVKPDLVVSAAHCFFDEYEKEVLNASYFAVAAGKTYSSYSRYERFAQRSFVKEIHLPRKYYGIDTNYALDIAFVRTNTSFNYTVAVRPVCIDVYNKNNDLRHGSVGKVPGWGIADDDKPSTILRMLALPYIPHKDCIDAVPDDFKPTVSVDDKFCAGYLNGSSVCPGDSGGGLCFELNGLWYLRGIVSVGSGIQRDDDVKCKSNSYTVFTDIGKHLERVRDIYVSSQSEGAEGSALLMVDRE